MKNAPSLPFISNGDSGTQQHRSRRPDAFSLIELLVATAVLSIIMMMLMSLTNIVSRTWKGVTEKMEGFEAARTAFDRLSTNLSQAVLNTYWEYDNLAAPTKYERRSELQFLSLPMRKIAAAFPVGQPRTHGLFFQAPTGQVTDKNTFGQLPLVLNAYGYFVEYGDDSQDRPKFLPAKISPRYRFRLKEWRVPADNFSLYAATSGTGGRTYLGDKTLGWIDPSNPTAHTLADNIVALIIYPKSTDDITLKASSLTLDYYYNSRNDGTSTLELSQRHQLPSEVEIVMIAVDETSTIQQFKNSTTPPDLGEADLFTNPEKLEDDITSLTDNLTRMHINYIVLRSTVKIHGARWTRD